MNYEYSEKEFLSAKNKIISSLTKNVYPNNMPQAFLLGGQPGAGKTGLQYIIKQQLADSQNIIIISGDAYRIYHPRINEIEINGDDLAISTQEFVHKMTESIISDLIDILPRLKSWAFSLQFFFVNVIFQKDRATIYAKKSFAIVMRNHI